MVNQTLRCRGEKHIPEQPGVVRKVLISLSGAFSFCPSFVRILADARRSRWRYRELHRVSAH